MIISFLGAALFIGFGVAIGLTLGWCFWHPINRLSLEDLREELDRRLRFEEIEAAERKLKAKLVASRRRSVPRPNTGVARVSKINITTCKEG